MSNERFSISLNQMLQSTFLVMVFTFIYLIQDSSASHLVATKVGSCIRKKAYGIIRMRKFECQRMGGRWNGRPRPKNWINCHLDWCEIPGGKQNVVARGNVWSVCKDRSQRASGRHTYGIIRMKRYECDLLNGKRNGNPAQQSWMNCHLYWCRFNGYNKHSIWGIVPASFGTCGGAKIGYGIIRMLHRECRSLKGRWNGRPRSNQWDNCHLDWCVSDTPCH